MGLLPVTAAALEDHKHLTVRVEDEALRSWRPFAIFQMEFELALGIRLLPG